MLGCILFILRWNDVSTSRTAIAQTLWFAGANYVLAIKCAPSAHWKRPWPSRMPSGAPMFPGARTGAGREICERNRGGKSRVTGTVPGGSGFCEWDRTP